MFTIKLYAEGRQRILSAQSFTVLRDAFGAEITLHQTNQADDKRYDVSLVDTGSVELKYHKAIIENAAGRTTEIIVAQPLPGAK